MLSPGASLIVLVSTLQGSSPAPVALDNGVETPKAVGRANVPLRPINSRRSPVQPSCWPLKSANATRDPKAALHGFRANIAPVAISISVATNAADAWREEPRTHSTSAATERSRG